MVFTASPFAAAPIRTSSPSSVAWVHTVEITATRVRLLWSRAGPRAAARSCCYSARAASPDSPSTSPTRMIEPLVAVAWARAPSGSRNRARKPRPDPAFGAPARRSQVEALRLLLLAARAFFDGLAVPGRASRAESPRGDSRVRRWTHVGARAVGSEEPHAGRVEFARFAPARRRRRSRAGPRRAPGGLTQLGPSRLLLVERAASPPAASVADGRSPTGRSCPGTWAPSASLPACCTPTTSGRPGPRTSSLLSALPSLRMGSSSSRSGTTDEEIDCGPFALCLVNLHCLTEPVLGLLILFKRRESVPDSRTRLGCSVVRLH